MKPKLSATPFWIKGKIPPPTTIVIKIPDAEAVKRPNPSTARLNIPPHITEVHNPIKTRYIALIGTLASKKLTPLVVL